MSNNIEMDGYIETHIPPPPPKLTKNACTAMPLPPIPPLPPPPALDGILPPSPPAFNGIHQSNYSLQQLMVQVQSISPTSFTGSYNSNDIDIGIDIDVETPTDHNIDINQINEYNINQMKKEYQLERESNLFSDENELINNIFGNYIIRSLYINISLFIFCLLSFALWFIPININNKYDNDIQIAHNLASFAMISIFLATIFGAIIPIYYKNNVSKTKTIMFYIAMSLYFIGSFFYFVSGCQYAQSYNNFGNKTSFGAIWWTEMFYISAISFIAGIDLYKRFLNRLDHRIYTMFSLYLFCSMILSISYLSSSSDISYIMIGISFIFGVIISILFLLNFLLSLCITSQYIFKEKYDSIKFTINLILAILLSINMLITVFSYWCGNRLTNQHIAYYFGFGLFMFSMNVMMVCDIRFSMDITKKINKDDIDGDDDDDSETDDQISDHVYIE